MNETDKETRLKRWEARKWEYRKGSGRVFDWSWGISETKRF